MNTHAKIKKLTETIHNIELDGRADITHEITLVATDLTREEYLEITRQHLNDHTISISLAFIQQGFGLPDNKTGELHNKARDLESQPAL